uniref:Uncharacterized protein n=1 Tax=Naja naja TaxID=35670 RepID=A0A8C6X6K7_NAJNA
CHTAGGQVCQGSADTSPDALPIPLKNLIKKFNKEVLAPLFPFCRKPPPLSARCHLSGSQDPSSRFSPYSNPNLSNVFF